MKTQKQVLEMFAGVQRKLSDKVNGFVSVESYLPGDRSGYWCVTMRVSYFEGHKMARRHEIEWPHYSLHDEECEAKNEKKFNEFLVEVL